MDNKENEVSEGMFMRDTKFKRAILDPNNESNDVELALEDDFDFNKAEGIFERDARLKRDLLSRNAKRRNR